MFNQCNQSRFDKQLIKPGNVTISIQIFQFEQMSARTCVYTVILALTWPKSCQFVLGCPPGQAFMLNPKFIPTVKTPVPNAGTEACYPCMPGTSQPRLSGMVYQCEPCAAGTYMPNDGAQNCFPCQAGSANSLLGRIACSPCKPGTFAPKTINPIGASRCTFCPKGTYQMSSAQSSCTTCPSNKPTTTSTGCSSPYACTL